MTVLIIEDDDSLAALLATAIRKNGLPVDVAADGLEALRLLHARDYDVILLDLAMPRFDGFQFLESVRSAAPRVWPPIVVMTGMDSTIARALPASEVHAIVHKPFDAAEVAAMIAAIADRLSSAARQPLDMPSSGIPEAQPDR